MQLEILATLDEADRRAVIASSTRRRYPRRDTIFHEGDPGDTLHMLIRGHVAVRSSTPLGDVVTLRVLGPGAYFGELALLDPDRRRTATAVALDAVETLALHRRDFEQLCNDHPPIRDLLIRLLAQRVDDLSARLVEALHVTAEARVRRHLYDLTVLFASDDGGPVVIGVTQDDLASLAGTTRPTANRALQALADQGLVELSRNRITVPEGSALMGR